MHDTKFTTRITALIAAADRARWLSWHGPMSARAAHAAHADALIEQLRRIGVEWAKGCKMDNDPPVYGYVGRCRSCGTALAWCRDDPDRRTFVGNNIADMIRRGLFVEYSRADVVYVARKMCGCVQHEEIRAC